MWIYAVKYSLQSASGCGGKFLIVESSLYLGWVEIKFPRAADVFTSWFIEARSAKENNIQVLASQLHGTAGRWHDRRVLFIYCSMISEQWQGRAEVFGKKSVPVPKMWHGRAPLCKTANNGLNHGTVRLRESCFLSNASRFSERALLFLVGFQTSPFRFPGQSSM